MAKAIKDRYVYGPSGSVGYIMKPAGRGKVIPHNVDECIRRTLIDAQHQEERNRMNHAEYMKKFWVSSDKHSLNSRIERFVDTGMKSYELDLEQKRNKLKVMMLDERSQLTHDYIDKAQKSADIKFQSKVKKAEEIESQAAETHRSFVQKAYDRIFKENCDELRTKTNRENRRALMEIHKKQICDKLLAEKIAEEEDKMWAALEYEQDLQRHQRIQNEASTANENSKKYSASLDQQMRELELKKYNEKCVDIIEESERQAYQRIKDQEPMMRELEAKRLREIHARELSEQMEANRLLRERNKKDEKQYDKIVIEEDTRAAEKEKLAFIDNRAQTRYELSIFRESLKQYNDALAVNEKEIEVIREDFQKQRELERLAIKQRSAQAKRNLLNNCVEVRKQQVTDRKEVEQKIKDAKAKEAKYIQTTIAQNEALDVAKRQKDLRENQEATRVVNECEKYEFVQRERERLEMENFTKERQKKFEEIDMKTKELLSKPIHTLGTDIHPFLSHLLATEKSLPLE